jgi:hypothetical protein
LFGEEKKTVLFIPVLFGEEKRIVLFIPLLFGEEQKIVLFIPALFGEEQEFVLFILTLFVGKAGICSLYSNIVWGKSRNLFSLFQYCLVKSRK